MYLTVITKQRELSHRKSLGLNVNATANRKEKCFKNEINENAKNVGGSWNSCIFG